MLTFSLDITAAKRTVPAAWFSGERTMPRLARKHAPNTASATLYFTHGSTSASGSRPERMNP